MFFVDVHVVVFNLDDARPNLVAQLHEPVEVVLGVLFLYLGDRRLLQALELRLPHPHPADHAARL